MLLTNNPRISAIVRRLLPRQLRNALRRPRVTLERTSAKLRHLFGAVAEVTVQPGLKVRCHPMSKVEFEVFQNDPEQGEEMAGFIALATPGMRLLDIGAHWGVFTLAGMHFGGKEARSICIEASSAAAKVLAENLVLNGFDKQVCIVNAACGAENGELRMLTTGAGGADYFVVPAGERPDTISVPQVTADTVCGRQEFRPTHLKVDVEGFEEEVLRGAQGVLREFRPVVFLELHGSHIEQRGKSAATVLDLLETAGYHEWTTTGGASINRSQLAAIGYHSRMTCHPKADA